VEVFPHFNGNQGPYGFLEALRRIKMRDEVRRNVDFSGVGGTDVMEVRAPYGNHPL
jgi:hypothetical protein